MSIEQEISGIIREASGLEKKPTTEAVANALKEIKTLFTATNDSLVAMCKSIEQATTRSQLQAAFGRLDGVMRILFGVAPDEEHGHIIRDAVVTLDMGTRLRTLLMSTAFPRTAIVNYKTEVLKDLAVGLLRKKTQATLDKELNEQLFAQFLPSTESADQSPVDAGVSQKRRGTEAFGEEKVSTIPKKKSRVPALVNLQRASGAINSDGTVKKNVLITREKLRAGLHDPKGLLDLLQSSTNALEHTKKLELLKTSGLLNTSRKIKSFPDKLSEATVRLGLGLGGHTVVDSLIFGAKGLGCPGFLSNKNISEIENNIVDGKTTWKHQNMYGKLMIAGCISQAKRILKMYDDVLYGSSPEEKVQTTHKEIRKLLLTTESRDLLREQVGPDEVSDTDFTNFIKKIVETVAPIIPITLRNKSLDGAYFRTALHLIAAAELLFARYEVDVRLQANPSGVVGMSAAMHADLENACFYNNELRSLEDFTKEMKSQYQTSLGLGTSFSKDTFQVTRRRNRGLGRGFYRSRQALGLNRSQTAELTASGTMQRGRLQARGRGVCFGYSTGTCNRGTSCRFLHLDQQ